MRRWKFIVLISLMVISLLGIIGVQLVWINNAVGVRRDLFAGAVFQSLQNTAKRVESARNLEFYRRMMAADSIFQAKASEYLNASIPDNLPAPDQIRIIPRGSGESFSLQVTSDGSQVVMSGDYSSYSYLDTVFSINDPIIIPSREINSGHRPTGRFVATADFQSWIEKRTEDLRNMGNKMVAEIYNWERKAEIDKADVYRTLNNELANQGIFSPFEFAIIDNGRIVDGYYKKGSEQDFLASNYSVDLFSDNIIRKDSRLALYFPNQKNYILGSMSILLGGSMLFSLIILLTFALSIFFILRQKKISEVKSDFLNNMTHEFKTPIATISLAADTISNHKIIGDKERVNHFISLIKKENSRMNKQVENILQISSLDKSEIDFCFEELDFHEVIGRAIETISIQVEEKGGGIFYYPEAGVRSIIGDKEHLSNLVHNLLDNANKYSPEKPEITVRTESSNGSFRLSVEDKGIGMTKSVQSRIFERFYRQSKGNVHNVKGFGLGLSYVKAIVEAHHGEIEVFSEPGIGTRFVVTLPLNS